ncbi:hypothetical protein SAMN04515649_10650 [Eubacterium callanderi]|uniref:Uncharacterized protein n=1 Tax=Eubacterium callanderi TaxID=53442 RepID=A0AB74EYX9_9FIRM|nr:hypothetical protein [Eubacterium callanderi]MDY7112187.1 hypothetical protein [Eubacterium callanderi]SHL57212.1 hypothetical protein SAMN04515649_10650 [Eubacterium callanderi]
MKERSKWRERLNILSIKIENGNSYQVSQAITELKVRLNPCGYFDNNNFYKDGHVWALLKNNNTNIVDQKTKKQLIKYIGLFLNHDWERCKRESLHWCFIPYEILGGTLAFLSLMSILYTKLLMFNSYADERLFLRINLLIFFVLAVMILIIEGIFFFLKKKENEKYITFVKKYREEINDITKNK